MISYLVRNGWRHTLLALVNLFVLMGLLFQTASLISISQTRSFFQEMSEKGGYGGTPIFGSSLVEWLIHPLTTGCFAVVVAGLIIKELFVKDLSRRFLANIVVLMIGFVVFWYVSYILYTPFTRSF